MKLSKKTSLEHTSLENKVNEMIDKMEKKDKYKKVMVTSDYHIPYMNKDSYEIMKGYAKDYKPDIFVINGDLIDLYSVSKFDKSPDRKFKVNDEVTQAKHILKNLRSSLGKNVEMYYLEGNHENRLQKWLWRNPEMDGLEALKIPELLKLKKYDINWIGVDSDYWSVTTGHLRTGNTIVMHGDARLNGASLSKYAGYSVKNTMLNGLQSNVVIGHNHRLAQINHRTANSLLQGAESGCLCQLTGFANWQNGFVTYELVNNEMVNLRTHLIKDNKMYEQGFVYENMEVAKKRHARKRK